MKIRNNKLFLYAFIVAFTCISLACSKNDDKIDTPIEAAECGLIELETQSVFPTDKLYINGIEDNLKEDLIVEFWHNNVFTGASMNVPIDENDKSYIIAPLHPELPLEGGELQLVFKDNTGEIICSPKLLIISELPKADGYTNEVTIGLQNLLKQRTDYLNLDEAILSGDLENIDPMSVPFALLYNLLHNEDAEFSLIPFLNNDEVLISESVDKTKSIDISNRLLKKYNVLEYINQNINDFEIENIRSKTGTAIKASSLDGCFGLDAEDLAAQMKSAANTEYSDPSTITGKYFEDLSNAATAVGFFPPAATGATIVGGVIFLIQKVEEAYSKTRLSHFTQFEFSISNTDFLEETACPEPIITANVHAASDEWSMDKTLWEFALQVSSFIPTPAPTKGNENIESFGYGVASTFTSTQLNNLANQGVWENGILKIHPRECGPIDVLNTKYLMGRTNGSAFEVNYTGDNGIEIYPIATGDDVIELSLRPEYFSGQTISSSRPLSLIPIELTWENPIEMPLIIEPGDLVDLETHLKNADPNLITLSSNLEVYTSIGEEGLDLFQEFNVADTYVKKYTYQTPVDQNKYPITVTAKYDSDKCFKGSTYGQPDIANVIIDIGKVIVYTNDETCFESGETRDFDVEIYGNTNEVVWSATNEAGQGVPINQDGVFVAPETLGTYYIKASLVNSPQIFDTYSVEVVESCGCYWNFTGGNFETLPSYNKGYFRLDNSAGTIPFQINLYEIADVNSGADHIAIYLKSDDFIPSEGETITVFGTEDYDAILNDIDYETTVDILGTNFNEHYYNFYTPIEYTITLTLNNNYLEGTITGVMYKNQGENDDVSFSFTINFGVFEYNSDSNCR